MWSVKVSAVYTVYYLKQFVNSLDIYYNIRIDSQKT